MLVNWLERHGRLTDAALVLLVFATTVGASGRADLGGHGVPIALVVALPLLARHRYPLATLAVTTTSTIVVFAAWEFYNPLPAGIALYTVASRCERRVSLISGGAALVALTPAVWSSAGSRNGFLLAGRLLPFVVAWLVGDSVAVRRRYVRELEEKADRLEREREIEAARAVAEEQARIARELHDVIAHNLSVMVVQAGAADDVFETHPDRAHAAIRHVKTTGQAALAELRQLLGAVRRDGAEYAPQPGLARLDELAAEVRAAGLEVTLTIDGSPRTLPTALELSAYRIVQEALTNTLKHAHANRAEIAVRYGVDTLDVEVRDDGTGNGGGSGRGLIGMRERVGVFGGSLTAGPSRGGGYSVAARFPLPAS